MSDFRSRVLIAIAVCVLTIFLGSVLLDGSAYYIDNMHWEGAPLPPCFVNAPSCGGHILGTDEVGRDLLSRLVVGARTSIINSTAAMAIGLTGAALLVALARFGGGVGRYAASRLGDAASAVPPWPFIIVFGLLFAPEMRVGRGLLCAAIAGVLLAPNFFRGLAPVEGRAERRPTIGREWVSALLTLATIDFFGWGVQPPTPSLGNMLVSMQSNLMIAWWAAVFPGAALLLIALCIAAASAALRTTWRQRRRRLQMDDPLG